MIQGYVLKGVAEQVLENFIWNFCAPRKLISSILGETERNLNAFLEKLISEKDKVELAAIVNHYEESLRTFRHVVLPHHSVLSGTTLRCLHCMLSSKIGRR